MTPIFWPWLTGATSGCCASRSALTLSAWPFGMVMYISYGNPAFTSGAAPFQTAMVFTAWPLS